MEERGKKLKSKMVLVGMSSSQLLDLLQPDFPKLTASTLSRYIHGTVGTPQESQVMDAAERIVGERYAAVRN